MQIDFQTSETDTSVFSDPRFRGLEIAVLVPCFNEAVAVGKVVSEFKAALPGAAVYVYDNNSVDNTAELAKDAGAVVRHEPLQGKGNVVRRMFADIEADIYLLVDGDDTYDPESAVTMIEELIAGPFDMVTGLRSTDLGATYRPGHRFGRSLLAFILGRMFGQRIDDVFSGYRAFSRRFVKSFPALTTGFEIETELTLHALQLRMRIVEVQTRYRSRPEGSASKLHTFRDGLRVLETLVLFLKEERPLHFFGFIFMVLAGVSIGLGIPVVSEFIETGLVPRLPTAVLASAIMLLAFLSLTVGLILDTVTRGRNEMKRLHYLSIPAVRSAANKRDEV